MSWRADEFTICPPRTITESYLLLRRRYKVNPKPSEVGESYPQAEREGSSSSSSQWPPGRPRWPTYRWGEGNSSGLAPVETTERGSETENDDFCVPSKIFSKSTSISMYLYA